MGSSIFIEADTISGLAGKIAQARRLYGADSSYVIGLITGLELLLESTDGGSKTRDLIHSQILEAESGKPTPASPETGVAAGDTLVENTWVTGVVKWFNNDKGYGFISTDSHIDVFVHWRDISSWDRSLAQGDEVEFMVTRTAKGFQAINVMKGGQEADSGQARTAAQAGAEAFNREPQAGEPEQDVAAGEEAEGASVDIEPGS